MLCKKTPVLVVGIAKYLYIPPQFIQGTFAFTKGRYPNGDQQYIDISFQVPN